MNLIVLMFVMLSCIMNMHAQFPDRVGMPDCDAISAEREGLVWGTSCTIIPGYITIANPSQGMVSTEEASLAIGAADDAVVSLGDGGMCTMMFARPIADGPGADFAVFENAFDDYFLELAFVEVSSDGEHFVRFPAVSLTQSKQQLGPFMRIPDVRALNNLAGKYRRGFGTPFDLSALKDSAGIDIQSITHVRVIDVIGSIDSQFASRDSRGNIINDPWPTPFSSCGFDLDGIAVINEKKEVSEQLTFAPNPIHAGEHASARVLEHADALSVYTMQGEFIREGKDGMVDIHGMSGGMYIVKGMHEGRMQSGILIIMP